MDRTVAVEGGKNADEALVEQLQDQRVVEDGVSAHSLTRSRIAHPV